MAADWLAPQERNHNLDLCKVNQPHSFQVLATFRKRALVANILALCLLFPSGSSVFLLETINHAVLCYKMTLTEQQIKIIAERPLNDALDRVRDKLRDDADDPRQEDIANLVGALALSPAAFSLPSPDGSGSVAVKLFPIIQHVREGVVKLNQFRPFVRYIVNNSLDFII